MPLLPHGVAGVRHGDVFVFAGVNNYLGRIAEHMTGNLMVEPARARRGHADRLRVLNRSIK